MTERNTQEMFSHLDLPRKGIGLAYSNMDPKISSPIKDEAVRSQSFIQLMDTIGIENYLRRNDLLDEFGKLRIGVKLICCGTDVSSLDQLCFLNEFMDLYEIDADDPVGYKVTDSAKAKYRDALHIVSPGPGNCAPRHAFDPTWTAPTLPMGKTAELHALFLHGKGERVMTDWKTIEDASIARALGTTPDQLYPEFDTAEQLAAFQYEETKHNMSLRNQASKLQASEPERARALRAESKNTRFGHARSAHLGTILGFGMSRNLQSDSKEMRERAPYTWQPGYPMHRAQCATIAPPDSAFQKSNTDLLAAQDKRMADVTSCPPVVHSMLPKLYEARIARHVSACYSDIQAAKDGPGLTLKGETYGGLLAPPTLVSSADQTHTKAGRATPLHPDTLTAPEIGMAAAELNNREAAVVDWPSPASRKLSQADPVAVGSDKPGEGPRGVYQSIRPPP